MTLAPETTALMCFIIGPIGDRLAALGTPEKQSYEDTSQMWENVFEPACNQLGLVPVRADKISDTGEIPEQIFVLLRDADVVIADVTGGNSNVMYELGMRHTRNKITVQIGERARLPFDITTIRTIQFRRTEAGLIDARNQLVETLRAALASGGGVVTATRVWSELERHLRPEDIASAAARSATSDDPLDAEDPDDLGMVDRLVAGEVAINRISGTLQEILDIIVLAGNVSTRLSPQISTSASFATRLVFMRQWSDELAEPTSQLDDASDRYSSEVNEIDTMVKIVVDRVKSDEDDLEELREGLQNFIDLSNSVEEGNVGITSMVKSVRDLRKLSNVLRDVSKSIEHSLNRVLSANSVISSWRPLIEGLDGWGIYDADGE